MKDSIIVYCENHGIYEIYKERGNIITYYSYFGNEGFYKNVNKRNLLLVNKYHLVQAIKRIQRAR